MNAALARFMSVDYGEKRVGLAIADELGMIASPAGFIARRAGKRAPVAEMLRRAEALEARGIVVGYLWTATVKRQRGRWKSAALAGSSRREVV